MAVWRRQKRAWHVVVTWMVVNRFLRRLVEQYASIFIRLLGASPVQLGAAQSAMGFAGILISLPLGFAQDRYSLKKIYLMGITLLSVAPFLYAVAPHWKWLIPAVLLMGLGQRLGACSVICDLSLPNCDRATGKALCEGVGALPTLFGPAIAAVTVTALGGVSVGSIRTLYWVYFLVGVGPTIYAYRNLPEIRRGQKKPQSTGVLSSFGEVFRRGKGLRYYMVFVTVSEYTLMMLTTFIFTYAYEVGHATPFVLGAMSTAVTLAEVVFSTVFGRLADRLGRKKVYLYLTPVFVMSSVLLVTFPAPFFMVLGGFMFGFRVIASVVYSSIAPELVPPDCIGRWRGILGFLTGFAHVAAPVVGGYLWEGLGPKTVFMTAVLVDLLVAVPLILALPETLKMETQGGLDAS